MEDKIMLTREQKESIVFYLSNCKPSYGSERIESQASMFHQFKKVMTFCDPEKLNWKNVDSDLLSTVPADADLSKKIDSKDFIEICKKLCTRWR